MSETSTPNQTAGYTPTWERPTPYFQRGDYVLRHGTVVTVLEDGYKPTVRGPGGTVVINATGCVHGTISQLLRECQLPPPRPLVDWIDPANGETFRTYAEDSLARAAGCLPLAEYQTGA